MGVTGVITLNATTEQVIRVTSRVTLITLRAIQGYAKTYYPGLHYTNGYNRLFTQGY